MSADFRTLLKESHRDEATGERWFEDIEFGNAFFLSIQASTLHDSTPSALLKDVNEYEAFQVTLQLKRGVFTCGKRGAWDHLSDKPWWDLLEEDSPILRVGARVPASKVQQIYDDVLKVSLEHPEVVSKKARTCQ